MPEVSAPSARPASSTSVSSTSWRSSEAFSARAARVGLEPGEAGGGHVGDQLGRLDGRGRDLAALVPGGDEDALHLAVPGEWPTGLQPAPEPPPSWPPGFSRRPN